MPKKQKPSFEVSVPKDFDGEIEVNAFHVETPKVALLTEQFGLGRVIARGMHQEKVQQEKNMMKAERRKATMLENAAQKALSGRN